MARGEVDRRVKVDLDVVGDFLVEFQPVIAPHEAAEVGAAGLGNSEITSSGKARSSCNDRH